MKRFLALLTAVFLLLPLCIPTLSVTAANVPTLSLEQANVEAGQSVEMRLSLSGNPGIVSMYVTIQFDASVLQLTKVENGEVFPVSTSTFGKELTGDSYTMLWLDALSTNNYTANGTLATLTFRAAENAAAGQTTVSLSYDANSVFDCNLQPVASFVTQDGIVSISRPNIAVTGVSVSPDSLTLRVGQTGRLTAAVQPANANDLSVKWESREPNIASVDEYGNVKALAAGSTSVIVTTNSGGKTATCSVTVQPAVVSVTGVTVSPTTLSLKVGGSSRLTATVQPSNATNSSVSWSSGNTGVATVDAQGNVTARGAGSTVITVTTADGGKSAYCTVSVTPVTIAVTGISMPGSLTMNYKDSARLTATVEPSNASNPAVIWSSDNSKVVEVDADGNLTTHRKGTATITATTVDGSKTATCRVTVQYTFMQKIIIYLLFGWIWYVK